MFNIMILDVAIGMIFIYLLLSLICSAAHEIIELLLKKRAIDLERGIRELLEPGSASGTPDVIQAFYNHPLINGLFEGKYETSRIRDMQRYVRRTVLPSYIPARNFALAIMDLVRPGTTVGQTSGATDATAGPPLPETRSQVDVNVTGVAPTAVEAAAAEVADPAVAALREALVGPAQNAAPAGAGQPASAPLITEQIRRALLPLIDAAGGDMIKVRENIEGWFNASMERVSGWYKRRAQVTLMILGLFIAITMNVDTITVVKRLSTDKALRESLVAAADAYAKANATTTAKAETSTQSATPTATPTPPPPSEASLARTKVRETACKEQPNSSDCQRAKYVEDACKVEDSPKCEYVLTQRQIQSLGLPIGWDDDKDSSRNIPAWSGLKDFGGWAWNQIYWHWLGWILTALAISLGAPFWFDLLNKFITIRSAVKPRDTSPSAGS